MFRFGELRFVILCVVCAVDIVFGCFPHRELQRLFSNLIYLICELKNSLILSVTRKD